MIAYKPACFQCDTLYSIFLDVLVNLPLWMQGGLYAITHEPTNGYAACWLVSACAYVLHANCCVDAVLLALVELRCLVSAYSFILKIVLYQLTLHCAAVLLMSPSHWAPLCVSHSCRPCLLPLVARMQQLRQTMRRVVTWVVWQQHAGQWAGESLHGGATLCGPKSHSCSHNQRAFRSAHAVLDQTHER